LQVKVEAGAMRVVGLGTQPFLKHISARIGDQNTTVHH
jgi:hypothetical protein